MILKELYPMNVQNEVITLEDAISSRRMMKLDISEFRRCLYLSNINIFVNISRCGHICQTFCSPCCMCKGASLLCSVCKEREMRFERAFYRIVVKEKIVLMQRTDRYVLFLEYRDYRLIPCSCGHYCHSDYNVCCSCSENYRKCRICNERR